ncbi:TPA: hypothetical protein ACIJRN_004016 [Klebsiella aerogenes]
MKQSTALLHAGVMLASLSAANAGTPGAPVQAHQPLSRGALTCGY